MATDVVTGMAGVAGGVAGGVVAVAGGVAAVAGGMIDGVAGVSKDVVGRLGIPWGANEAGGEGWGRWVYPRSLDHKGPGGGDPCFLQNPFQFQPYPIALSEECYEEGDTTGAPVIY